MRYRQLLILLLGALLLTACAPSFASPAPEVAPTSQPEQEFANLTVVVTRIGEQAGGIGWHASGEIQLNVALDIDIAPNVTGTGVGVAGFDASANNCIDLGGWPVEYNAQGHFDGGKCELTIIVEETWPKTEAFAVCAGVSGSGSGPEYKLNFPNLKFTEKSSRVDTELTQDMLTWINSFQIYPKDALEHIGCTFGDGSP
jgi:hypothetical protein